jgi:1,5-anhydro-D-fructose reductase (1,5-anhydro-D-mannitol-forming)
MKQKMNIGWGLIGASTIARQYMSGAISAQEGHFIQAVMSSSHTRAEEFAKDCKIQTAYSSLEQLLADPLVKVVYISTTNELHYKQAIAAATAGKHVLCEKPLALNFEQAIEMARACKSAGVLMATNHHLRNAAAHRKMKEMIEAGAIGKPLFARVFHAVHLPEHLQGWRINKPHAGGGVILDITVHDVDTLRFTLGAEIKEVVALSQSASMAKEGLEDGVMAAIRFENGVLAQIHDAFTVKHGGNGIEYHGEAGSLFGFNVMSQEPVGEIILRNADGEQKIAVQHESLYVRGVRTFCEALEGNGQPAATAEDGIKSLAGALAVLEACKTGIRQEVRSFAI